MARSERSRITAFTDFVYLRMRHRGAWDSATAEPIEGFDALQGRTYALLTTFRRNGEAVPTPVWFGMADGKVYVETERGVGKVKRMRATPRVRIAPCSLRGKPLGPPAEGIARIVEPAEAEHADATIAANYGLGRRLYEAAGRAFNTIDLVYIEITPASSAP